MSSGPDRRLGPWITLSIAALGCRDPARPPDPAAIAGSASARDAGAHGPPADAPAVARPAPPEPSAIELPHQESFQLLDAGRGARSPLRYALAPGTVAHIARTTLSSRHLEAAAWSAPVALPAIRDGFAVTVAAGQPDRVSLRALPGEAAADAADVAGYLAPWRAHLEGRDAAVAIDARGGLGAIAFADDPTGARGTQPRDELAQRLLSTIVPVPEEPVGAGASWRVITILRQGPAYARQTATYTLVARGPARWKLHVKLVRVGEPQPLVDPALPRGTTAELVALLRSLEGDVEIDPAHALIAGGTLGVESRMHVRLAEPGRPPAEQLFEDTGAIVLSECTPVATPARPTARPRLGPCPAGLSQ